MKMTIIVHGFVGKAVDYGFSGVKKQIVDPIYGVSLSDIKLNEDVTFVCVPTPMGENGEIDCSIVVNTVNELSQRQSGIIVIKSTVTPDVIDTLTSGSCRNRIVYNPEFLTERNAVKDYENQNRIILGGPRPATTKLKRIFSKVFPSAHIIKTDSTHAEMVKYLTNTFLSVKVSFANEIYLLCDKLNVDYDKVVEYATYDERLGKSHWGVPGHDGDFGFGGHCFPKDLAAILHLSDELNTINNVLHATQDTNDEVRKNRDWEEMKGRAVS